MTIAIEACDESCLNEPNVNGCIVMTRRIAYQVYVALLTYHGIQQMSIAFLRTYKLQLQGFGAC